MSRTARLTVLAVLCLGTSLVGCSGDALDEASSSTPVTHVLDPTGTTRPDATERGDLVSPERPARTAATELAELEAEHDVVVGVFAVDTGTGATVGYRADERFAYASTHKAFSAGAVLVDAVPEDLEREVAVDVEIQPHSPVTGPVSGSSLPLREVLRAAVIESDNTAGNLILTELGGPEGFASVLRDLGDEVTSADRWETALNDWSPGEERDTTTPQQAVETLRTLLYGDALAGWARDELFAAMRDVTSAGGLVRAAAPATAVVANKSGAASHGVRADIAAIEEPGRAPIVIAVYTFHRDPGADWSDGPVAVAARIALDELATQGAG